MTEQKSEYKAESGAIYPIKLVICDVDGTCVRTKSGSKFRKSADDWEWIPGRREKLLGLKCDVAFASNQGGVAFGYLDRIKISNALVVMAEEVDVVSSRVYICFNHPSGSIEDYKREDDRRKPSPGMLIEAMRDAGVKPEETLMVGDRPEDEQAAKNCGCHFVFADEYFGDID